MYPVIPLSLAKAFNSATVLELKSVDSDFASALGASFLAAAFFTPEAEIPSI